MLMHALAAAILITAQPSGPPLTAEEARALRIAMRALEADDPKTHHSYITPTLERLATLGPKAAPAVPLLMKMFERANVGEGFQGDFPRAATAAEVLGAIGPAAQPAVPLLMKCLEAEKTIRNHDGDRGRIHLRGQVAPQLARIAPTTELAEKFNLKLLNPVGEDDELEAILKALAIMGPVGKPAIPGIVACLERYREEKSTLTEDRAIEPLTKMGPDGVATLIEQSKFSRNDKERYLEAFGDMGPDAVPAVPLLVDLLLDQNARTRALAARSLGKIGVRTQEVIEGLRDATRDSDHDVTSAANDALKALRRTAPANAGTRLRPY